MDSKRLKELAREVVAEAFEEAELEEARKKKGKGGKGGSLPGPLIGYLMKKGVIGNGRKFKVKKTGVRKESSVKFRKKVTRKMGGRAVLKGKGLASTADTFGKYHKQKRRQEYGKRLMDVE